jgi:DNA invertase Pin-like site-specific DNA recombinase
MASAGKPTLRCAVYTRKSSEEGLEQPFNSLDAQREACLAFIASQKHEGWAAISTHYDDGGYSGGHMERPALKRLMDDIAHNKVQVVLVYKVDRMSRCLADFAKIIEILDAHQCSFVSVTQAFNTTTSMGRLTLNVLLSFAQFEREVTGERIRDKIAASKRKGMWMGGRVPLGYDLKDRKLVINPAEAELVRKIFRSYLQAGCVSKLKILLDKKGLKSKVRVDANGNKTGGSLYSRGALYKILQNRIYLGEVVHRDHVYRGEHEAIISRELWTRVEGQLRANLQAERNGSRAVMPSLLVGVLHDERGNRYTPSHTVKNGKRYRYYVSQAVIRTPGGQKQESPVRIPAGELESLVVTRLRAFLQSSREVTNALTTRQDNVRTIRTIVAAARSSSEKLGPAGGPNPRMFLRNSVSKVVVHEDEIEIRVGKPALRKSLLGTDSQGSTDNAITGTLALGVKTQLKRCGGQARLIVYTDTSAASAPSPAQPLVRAVARAHDWYGRIVRGELTGARSIARLKGMDERYVSRILQCAFIAPDIVESILEGRQPVRLNLEKFWIAPPLDWAAQHERLGFPAK